MEAHPRVQLHLVFALEPITERLHVLEHVEARVCGAACSVLVCHRVAEACQQALLVALHDSAAEPMNCLRAFLLESVLHFHLVLCVQPFQIRLGLKQVAATDQDGHLATFGGLRAPAGRRRREDVCSGGRQKRVGRFRRRGHNRHFPCKRGGNRLQVRQHLGGGLIALGRRFRHGPGNDS